MSLQATLNELRDEKVKHVEDARKIFNKADKEERDMTSEENGLYDELMEKCDACTTKIEGYQKRDRLSKLEDELGTSRGRETDPEDPQAAEKRGDVVPIEYRGQELSFDDNETLVRAATAPYRAAFLRYLKVKGTDTRDLEVTDQTKGGFLSPMQFVAQLIRKVDDAVFIRQFATVTPVTSGDSIGYPSLDADPADAEWVQETTSGGEDDEMKFGLREFRPHLNAKKIRVSLRLMQASAIPVENLVRDRFAFKFSITEEKAFLTGDGVDKPLGLFTVSNQGISAGRDISEDMDATGLTADGLINVKYALKMQYWAAARWMFHRDGVKQIRKLKDSENRFIWQPGLQAGLPDTLLSFPISMSEFVPNTFTTGQRVGILGDLTWYWIADSLQFELQRLDELHADTNQVAFIGRKHTDGMPVLEEAFVRAQLA